MPEFKQDDLVWVQPWGKHSQGYTARVIEVDEDGWILINTGEWIAPSLARRPLLP